MSTDVFAALFVLALFFALGSTLYVASVLLHRLIVWLAGQLAPTLEAASPEPLLPPAEPAPRRAAARERPRIPRPSRIPHPSLPMLRRLTAIAFIFGCCTVAWMVLGGTVDQRTRAQGAATYDAVGTLWGGPQVQRAPALARLGERTRTVTRQEPTGDPDGSFRPVTEAVVEATREPVPLAGTDVAADLRLDHRKKGLMWYPTYAAAVDARYRVEAGEAGRYEFAFPLPDASPVFSDLALEVDGRPVAVDAEGGRIVHVLELEEGEAAELRVRYGSQGVSTWRYAFGEAASPIEPARGESVAEAVPARGAVRTARDVRVAVTTDVRDVDFPEGTLSPTAKERTDAGWQLVWDHGTLVASADVGVEMPQRLNPGPWVSRVTFFAPVSLFLFFFAVFVLSLLRGVRLHPMHYFFLGAACFAFHLLLAYLVDVVSVGAAMAIASAVSVGLVVSYVRLVAGLRFALVEVGGAQAVYLVAFAATFFLEGMTGLAVTLLSVATLFVVMQATGRLDWEALLARPDADVAAARRDRPAVSV